MPTLKVADLISEDDLRAAVDALREVAAGGGNPPERVAAAQTLMSYGLLRMDDLGNASPS